MIRHITIFRMKNSCSSEHGKLFWGAGNNFWQPKTQLAARLKARDGLHSEVVAPESGKTGTETWKMTAIICRPPLGK